MPSTYTWTAGSGLWGNGADWADLTTPGAGTAPGVGDTATIAGPAYPANNFDLVFGPAAAATLTTTGNVGFAGNGTFGTLSLGDYGEIAIQPGAALVASSATLVGEMQIAGPGASLIVNGTISSASEQVSVYNGGNLRAQVLSGAFNFLVDPTATAEIGTAGIATAGTLAVDAGTSITVGGSFLSPVLDQGTIVAGFGNLVFAAPVHGTGQIVIANNGSLGLSSTIDAGVGISFAGPAGTLQLTGANNIFVGEITPVDGTVSGFQIGDVIKPGLPGVTAVNYAQTSPGLGTLSFTANGTVAIAVQLAGDFTGDRFSYLQGAAVLTRDETSRIVAAVSNPGNDAYKWNVTQDGVWATAANWTDTTASSTATTAPGATNTVTITNSSANVLPVLVGNGNAASLIETGSIALQGAFAVGTLTVGLTGGTVYAPGILDILAGSTVTATSATDNGTIVVAGNGASLAVAGSLLVSAFETLAASGGGLARAGALTLSFATVSIDALSSVEIGAAGGAALGALTVDAGQTVNALGSTIDGAFVNNGLLMDNGEFYRSHVTIAGAITGSGTIAIGGYGYFVPGASVAATQTVKFVGTAATIDLRKNATLSTPVAGFDITDEFLATPNVTAATLTASGSAGTLTLSDSGGATVRSLAVAGALAGNSFVVMPVPSVTATAQSAAIILVGGTLQTGLIPAAPAGSAAGQTFQWQAQGGAWGAPSSWGTTIAPGSLDTVSLGLQGGFYTVVTGAGNAAKVTETSGDVLSGVFNFGSLVIHQYGAGYGWLDVTAGATLGAGNITVEAGTLDISGVGASLTVAGTLTLGNTAATSFETGNLSVTGGARAQVARLVLNDSASNGSGDTIDVDSTSVLEIGTLGGAAVGVLTVDSGSTVAGTDNDSAFLGSVRNDGTIVSAKYQTRIAGSVSGGGTLSIANGSQLTVSGTIAATQTISFAGATGQLTLSAPTAAPIVGFGTGDEIILSGTITQANYTATGAGIGYLTLSNDGTAEGTLDLLGSYTGASFVGFASYPQQMFLGVPVGSIITLAAACFAEGTRIETADGPVAIEALAVGQGVRTLSGEVLPVQWIGRRLVDARRHPCPADVWPVRVAAHAFGPGRPTRPVFLSPDHAVHVRDADGRDALIPVRLLIDGDAIRQVLVERVTYWHIELPRHEIVLSDGLASESYLDTGNRSAFANAGAMFDLYPSFAAVPHVTAFAPLVVSGPLLEATLARLVDQRRVAA